jgi:hypothetical protein
MKKLVLFFLMAFSFSFANAQKVIGISFVNYGQPVNLEGLKLTLPPNPPTNVTIPIAVFFQNTGDVLNTGDSLHMTFFVEGQNVLNFKITLNDALATDSVSYVNLQQLSVATSSLKDIKTWCFGITEAYRSGVETAYSDTLCATFTIQSAGVNEITENETIIYPNPAKDVLKIDNVNNADIYIYNTIGQMVKRFSNVVGNTEINISDLNNGMYIVRIQKEKSIQTKKIQIIK